MPEIGQAIVDKLRVRLERSGPLVKRHTENLEAYDLCLRARHHLYKMTPEGHGKCIQYCERAITLDPGYALTYVRLAHSCVKSTILGFLNPRESLPRAKSAALEALKLDHTLAEAHGILAWVLGYCDFDWKGAERELRRALELDPASPDNHYYACMLLFATGRPEEALAEMGRALERDPLSAYFNAFLGYLYAQARQHDRSLAHCRLAIELDPNLWFAHWMLALAHLNQGLLNEALSIAEPAVELFGRYSCLLMCLGGTYAVTSRTAEARQILEELKTRSHATYVQPFAIATIHLALGELDQGMEWTAKAAEEHDLLAVSGLKSDLYYAPLRSHPTVLTRPSRACCVR